MVLDSDLDQELTRLREGARGALSVPGFEQVVARHKQRVVRRRMQIGAAVAVLVVTLAIPLLRGQMVAHRDPAAPPTNEPVGPRGPFINDVAFADADHGYAIRITCRTGCAPQLLTTTDGRRWQSHPLSRPKDAPSWATGTLELLGPDELTIDWGLSLADDGAPIHRTYSSDGGRTWREVDVPGIVTETVSSIPDDATLAWRCARLVGGGEKCAERGFAVVLPGSGRSARLAAEPPLTAMVAGASPTADGRWWVAGRDPRTNLWGLSVSDDNGRSWTTRVLDFRESVDYRGWTVIASGGTLYASASGSLPTASNALLAVFASTDGGRTWERTWTPADDKQPHRVFGGLVPGADGSLMINAPDDKTYVSKDGGRTFTAGERRYPDYAFPTRAGYVAMDISSSTDVRFSRDGVDWKKITLD